MLEGEFEQLCGAGLVPAQAGQITQNEIGLRQAAIIAPLLEAARRFQDDLLAVFGTALGSEGLQPARQHLSQDGLPRIGGVRGDPQCLPASSISPSSIRCAARFSRHSTR